jgi:hypothetical protein
MAQQAVHGSSNLCLIAVNGTHAAGVEASNMAARQAEVT